MAISTTNLTGKPIVVIVEGKDEVVFYSALIEELELGEKIDIIDGGGKTNFRRKHLFGFVNQPLFKTNVKVFSLVLDADDDPSATNDQLNGVLRDLNIALPNEQPTPQFPQIKTKTNILPSPTRSGMLEDLCLDTIAGQPIENCINNFISCVESTNGESFSNPSKTRFLTFMASWKNPVNRGNIEKALQEHILDLQDPAFNSQREFLKNLFDLLD